MLEFEDFCEYGDEFFVFVLKKVIYEILCGIGYVSDVLGGEEFLSCKIVVNLIGKRYG